MLTQASNRSFKHIRYHGKRPKNDQENQCREKLSYLVRDIGNFNEIYPEKLYLINLAKDEDFDTLTEASNDPQSPFIFWFFDGSQNFNYEAFNMDFGPFNLATTHLFCSKLKIWLDTQTFRNPDKYIVIVLNDTDTKRKLNATLLVAVAAMVLLNMTDEEVIQSLSFFMSHKAKPGEQKKELVFREKKKFSDVSGNQSILNLTLEDCIKAFYAAIQHKFYDYYTFDHAEYLFYETVMSGDLNWIVPGKILAFAGPNDSSSTNIALFYNKHSPQFYYHYFKDHNVTTIIRLNWPEYDETQFEDLGFDHHDLIFPDGYPPTSSIAAKFIKIVDQAKGAVAVHCYAGIGRTGTLIAAYLMTRYNFTCQMAIGWTRICRPGSVIGEQQDWLYSKFDPYSVDRISSSKAGKVKKPIPISTLKPVVDDIKPEQDNKTSYSIAEKTYGQAKALLLTKKRREKIDRPNTRRSALNKKIIEESESNNVQTSEKLDVILDLGKTIPLGTQLEDFQCLKEDENPEFYSIKDGKYEWKVKFPKPEYVILRYNAMKDLNAVRLVDKNALTFGDPSLDFKYETEEGEESETSGNGNGSKVLPKLKPIVYYSLVNSPWL